MPLEAGTRVGRYTVSRLLAQGGMAEVYRAAQELTKGITRPVALKVIRPEFSESPDFREMFLDEARTACTLSHPNIAQIYDVGESEDGLLYMAMELVPGETLAVISRTLREHDERFSDEALFAIGIWTASALEAVHALKTEGGSAGLVHRDVSPHNLLLAASGSLKLIDFGIAKAATNRNLTLPGVTKGKAGYFSPEQAMGMRLDGRSDLFSLGVTLYKLASGVTPLDDHPSHADRHAALVRGQWKRLEETFPGLPRPFYDVVNQALMLQPGDRFQSAREMREALEKAAFDSQLRVGQSSLLGYVNDEGLIFSTGGSRSSASPSVIVAPEDLAGPRASAPLNGGPPATETPASKKYNTERVIRAAKPARKQTGLVLALAFSSAIVIGVFGTLLVASEPPAPPPPSVPVPPPAPVVATPPDLPPPAPAAAPPDEVRVVPPLVVELPPTPPPPVTRPEPRRPTPSGSRNVPSRVEAPRPPPPTEEEIPAGIGTIVIGLSGDDSGAKVVVRGASSFEDVPPVQKKVPSGRYSVQVLLGNGATSPTWSGPVMPDQHRRLTYEVTARRWR